jgi:hypothetical protein
MIYVPNSRFCSFGKLSGLSFALLTTSLEVVHIINTTQHMNDALNDQRYVIATSTSTHRLNVCQTPVVFLSRESKILGQIHELFPWFGLRRSGSASCTLLRAHYIVNLERRTRLTARPCCRTYCWARVNLTVTPCVDEHCLRAHDDS